MSVNSVSPTPNLTKQDVQDRCDVAIEQGFASGRPTLVDALPTIGKTTGVIRWAARTDKPLTILTARYDLYDQLGDCCEREGLTYKILPAFHRDCPTASGDRGAAWKRRVNIEYNRSGLSGIEIHHFAHRLFGRELPCGEDCPYLAARDFDPAEYDLLIGHFRHAYVAQYLEGRYFCLDEFPESDFLTEFTDSTVAAGVTGYLRRNPELPFVDYTDLLDNRSDFERKEEVIEWFREHDAWFTRAPRAALQSPSRDVHAEAAKLVYGLVTASNLENGWEAARFPDGTRLARDRGNSTMFLMRPPKLDLAEGIVALDGTPVLEKWRFILGPDFQHLPVLSDVEKAEYLRDTLKLRFMVTTTHLKAYDGRDISPRKDMVLLDAIAQRIRGPAVLITTKKARTIYEESYQEVLDRLPFDLDHYGNVKGINKYAAHRHAVIVGSPNNGDDYIKRWGAFAGISVERNGKGIDVDFGPFGTAILHGMRENEVIQAAMRVGRDGKGGTIYLHTAALPSWVEAEQDILHIHPWADGMQQVIDAARGRPEWRTKEIVEHDEVTITPEQVRKHLNTLARYGYIERHGMGRGRWWSEIRLDSTPELGHVKFKNE